MALKSFRDANPYVIGIVSVLFIAGATAFAFAVGILRLFEDSYTVTAEFADSAGISGGDDIRVAGVKVGRVGDVEADRKNGTVRIDLVVNEGIQLGPRTRAEIALETLLGTKFVRLAGPVEEPFLEDGASIPLDRTKIPFDVFELAKKGTRAIEATDTERLNLLVDQLATVTDGRRGDLESLFEGIDRLGAALDSRESEFKDLLDQVESISGTLAEKDRVLLRLVEQSEIVLQVLNENRVQLSEGLEATDQLTAQLASLASVHRDTLDNLLDNLHDTVDVVDERQEDLDRALAYLGPGALGLAQAVDHGPWADVFAVIADEDPSEGS